MEQYIVTGMSCAACSARVEKAVSNVEGVTSCSVSLLTNSMGVEGDVSPAEVIAAVEAAGYGAASKAAEGGHKNEAAKMPGEELLEDKEADDVPLFSASVDVCLYGAYDVELAGAGSFCRKSRGYGLISTAVYYSGYDRQSEVFHQRV